MTALRKVSVAILTWNGRHHLETCLPALAAQHDPGVEWEVLVLDNGSTDGTVAWMREHWGRDRRVRLLESPVNLGFCAGNNRLVRGFGRRCRGPAEQRHPSPAWLAGRAGGDPGQRSGGRGRRLGQDRGLVRRASGLRPRPHDLRRPRLPARLPAASRESPGAGRRGGSTLRLWWQPARPPGLVPRRRRLRRGLLRLSGRRGPGLASVVRRRAHRLRPRGHRPSPLRRHERPPGTLQPGLPLRAQRLLDRLQELRARPLGAHPAGRAADAHLPHPGAARKQSRSGDAAARPLRRPYCQHRSEGENGYQLHHHRSSSRQPPPGKASRSAGGATVSRNSFAEA